MGVSVSVTQLRVFVCVFFPLPQVLSRCASRNVLGRIRIGPKAHAATGRHVDQAAAAVRTHSDARFVCFMFDDFIRQSTTTQCGVTFCRANMLLSSDEFITAGFASNKTKQTTGNKCVLRALYTQSGIHTKIYFNSKLHFLTYPILTGENHRANRHAI